jgi:hypothetical protein
MSVPNVFANATTSIPLVQLDQNFNTGITLGNTTVYLGNTTTSFGNVTLTGAAVNGTVGATTPAAGKFTTINSDATGNLSIQSNGSTVIAVTSAGAAVTGTFSSNSITFSTTSGIIGTTTNDAAAAGSVGEYVTSSVAPGSAVAVSVSTQANDITTISLTAGNWLVSINGAVQSAGTATTRAFFWIGTTAGNSSAEANAATFADFNYALPANATLPGSVPSYFMALASTTTVRFKAQATFTGTAPTISGRISAIRVR